MRVFLSCLAGSFLVLFAQASPGGDKKPDNDKRIADIEKEIQDLESRIARLRAELAKLQPAAKVNAPELRPNDKTMKGTIASVSDARDGFSLRPGEKHLIYLTPSAVIVFSDKQPAQHADLQVGQMVTCRIHFVSATKSDPPTFMFDTDFVIIHRAKGEKPKKR